MCDVASIVQKDGEERLTDGMEQSGSSLLIRQGFVQLSPEGAVSVQIRSTGFSQLPGALKKVIGIIAVSQNRDRC